MPAINTTGRVRKHEMSEVQHFDASPSTDPYAVHNREYPGDLAYQGSVPAPTGPPKGLSAEAGWAIRGFIERNLDAPPGSAGPPQWLCFRPSDGRCFGTLMDAQLSANRDRFVLCRSDQVPSWEWLGRIRIAPDGTVTEVDA